MFQSNEAGDRNAVATVTNNEDPEKRGRIRVTCTALLGDETRELPGWIEPALSWGWFVVPDVGQQVTVSYSLGSSNDVLSGQSSISNSNVRWYGATLYTQPNADEPDTIGEEFTEKNYGKRRGFKTPNGHVLMFDDTQGDQQVLMTWAGGTPQRPKSAFWSIDKDGSFVCQSANGAVVLLNSKDSETSLIHPNGNRFVLTDDTIEIVDKFGNAIVMGAGGISIMSSNPITLHGSDTVVRNALHFVDALQVNTNISAAAAIMNDLTVGGAALKLTVAGAVPADGVALLAGVSTAAKT